MPNVFYCQVAFLCLLHPLNILVFKVVQCPLLVYKQYLQKKLIIVYYIFYICHHRYDMSKLAPYDKQYHV